MRDARDLRCISSSQPVVRTIFDGEKRSLDSGGGPFFQSVGEEWRCCGVGTESCFIQSADADLPAAVFVAYREEMLRLWV